MPYFSSWRLQVSCVHDQDQMLPKLGNPGVQLPSYAIAHQVEEKILPNSRWISAPAQIYDD